MPTHLHSLIQKPLYSSERCAISYFIKTRGLTTTEQLKMPRPTLSTIPLELLTNILTLACDDGGKTGCSLSLVSTDIRDVCLDTGADITTASVCGEQKLKKFLVMLHRRTPRSRRVRSLFLYHCGPPLPDTSTGMNTNWNRDVTEKTDEITDGNEGQ